MAGVSQFAAWHAHSRTHTSMAALLKSGSERWMDAYRRFSNFSLSFTRLKHYLLTAPRTFCLPFQSFSDHSKGAATQEGAGWLAPGSHRDEAPCPAASGFCCWFALLRPLATCPVADNMSFSHSWSVIYLSIESGFLSILFKVPSRIFDGFLVTVKLFLLEGWCLLPVSLGKIFFSVHILLP